MRAWTVVMLAVLGGCDPDDPCDPGYFADHGVCVPIVEKPGAADGGEEDAGSGGDADFGRACHTDSDCRGKAPACGAPMLPLCTAVNCLQGESTCPATWTCLDISGWERPYPEVLSLCLLL
jgi:hypothetical protein